MRSGRKRSSARRTAPLRSNTALLAKQSASIDAISQGRLTLGLAVGGREDDYSLSEVDFHRRGQLFDRQLEDLKGMIEHVSLGMMTRRLPHTFKGRKQPAKRKVRVFGIGLRLDLVI